MTQKVDILPFILPACLFMTTCSCLEHVPFDVLMFQAQCEIESADHKSLLQGLSVEFVTENGVSSLLTASRGGNLTVCRFLLESGSFVDTRSVDGHTSLMVACLQGYSLTCRLLLEFGADEEAVNNRGRSALMICCSQNHVLCLGEVLKQATKFDATDKDGNTALMIADKLRHVECANALIAACDLKRATPVEDMSHIVECGG